MAKIAASRLVHLVDTRVEITPEFCWAWTGSKWGNGYASLKVDGSNHLGHRVFYETLRAEITDGLTVDHLCRNRACVNPDHMELVTRGENTRRAQALRELRPHCSKGHALTDENTYDEARRRCKTCTRERQGAYNRAKASTRRADQGI